MADTADDRHRPRHHFTPPTGWMNDPNGLVKIGERHHLFYQHNPGGVIWGDIHWGHACSADLVRWRHRPVALAPDPELGMVFSGCAVVDDADTAGFGPGAAVAVFTHAKDEGKHSHQVQSLAVSVDGGETWRPWAENPALPNPGALDFRDPKVRWHGPTGRWVMALAVGDHVALWTSPDLRDWRHASDFGADLGCHEGVWECPDLIEVPGPTGSRWVMLVSLTDGGPAGGSATQYFIGDFDGERFTAEAQPTRWLDWGPDNYASVSWSGVEIEGAPVITGWMSNWRYANHTPTETWRGVMTAPRTLRLVGTDEGALLVSALIPGLAALTEGCGEIPPCALTEAAQALPLAVASQSFDLSLTLAWPAAATPERVELELGGLSVVIAAAEGQIRVDRGAVCAVDRATPRFEAPLITTADGDRQILSLRLLVDQCSVEIFAGPICLTALIFPDVPLRHGALRSVGGEAALTGGRWAALGACWEAP